MKYLYTKEQYKKIYEYADSGPLANDINWGDSLLGRLINSTWRKIKIEYSANQIEKLAKQIEKEFSEIRAVSIDQNELGEAKVHSVLFKLEVFIRNNNDESSIDAIIAETNKAIKEIKETKYKNKDNIINSLNDFIDKLEEYKSNNKTVGATASPGATTSPTGATASRQNYKKIIPNVKQNNYFIDGDKLGLFLPIIRYDKNLIAGSTVLDKKQFDGKTPTEVIEFLNSVTEKIQLDIIGETYNFDDDFYLRLKNYLKSNESNSLKKLRGDTLVEVRYSIPSQEIELEYKTSKNKKKIIKSNIFKFLKSSEVESLVKDSINYVITDYKEYILEYNQQIDILDLFKNTVVQTNMTQDKADELVEKFDNVDVEQISHKHVINILKLFNRAYKLYTTEKIPSGRTGGVVSRKTELEYDKIGEDIYRNKKVFNKFESNVQDILADYGSLFSKDVKVGKANGLVLLDFINQLISGDARLYKKGAQYEFIKNYFGIDIKNISSYGDGEGDKKPKESDVDNITKPSKVNGIFKFKADNSLSKGFYAIKDNNKYYYLFVYSIINSNSGDKYYLGKITNNLDSYLGYIPNVENIDTNTANLNPGRRLNNIPVGDLDIILFKYENDTLEGFKQNIESFLPNRASNIEDVKFYKFDLYELVDNKNNKLVTYTNDYDKKRIKSDVSFTDPSIKSLLIDLKNKYGLK